MLDIILAVVSGILAGGVSPFLFFKQERNSKSIDNEAKQSDEWRKLYNEAHEELLARDQKIDSLYDELGEVRRAYNEQTTKNTQIEVENTRLSCLMCKVPSCPKREPQTGY